MRENIPNYYNIAKWPINIYQMTVKYSKWPNNAFSILCPSKIYPNLGFWFEKNIWQPWSNGLAPFLQ
jgi:hypothetical protein